MGWDGGWEEWSESKLWSGCKRKESIFNKKEKQTTFMICKKLKEKIMILSDTLYDVFKLL